MNSESFEQMEAMTNAEHLLPTNDALAQPARAKTGNPFIDGNWQKIMAWLFMRRSVKRKPLFTTDAMFALLGDPPKSTDMSALMSRLRSMGHIKATKHEVHSKRKKQKGKMLRVWRIC
jgi:hypothetical protein